MTFPIFSFVDLFCLHQPQLEAFEDNEVENYTHEKAENLIERPIESHRTNTDQNNFFLEYKSNIVNQF